MTGWMGGIKTPDGMFEVVADDGTVLALRYTAEAAERAAREFLNRWPPCVIVRRVVGDGKGIVVING